VTKSLFEEGVLRLDLDHVSRLGPEGRLDVAQEAVRLAERSGDATVQGFALTERTLYLAHLGEFRGSIAPSP
jgi:hypothetical protein